MSFTTRIPGLRDRGKHSGDTIIRRLREENARLLARLVAADEPVALLTGERDDLQAQLDAAGIELSGAREDLRAAKKQIRHVEAIVLLRDREIDDLKRRVDVGVKAEHVIARTQEIPVITPVPAHQSPMAVTNPGHLPPTWACADDETQPVPVTS